MHKCEKTQKKTHTYDVYVYTYMTAMASPYIMASVRGPAPCGSIQVSARASCHVMSVMSLICGWASRRGVAEFGG